MGKLSQKPNVQLEPDLFANDTNPEVKAFIAENEFLPSLLAEAHSHLRHFFPFARLNLRVENDPEAVGCNDLILAVETSLESDEALDLLDEFCNEWWLANIDRAAGRLMITVAFI